MLGDKVQHRLRRTRHILARRVWVDGGMGQQLAGGVHDRQLGAGAQSRVDPKDDFAFERWGHENGA
jgi:hypothetical protein